MLADQDFAGVGATRLARSGLQAAVKKLAAAALATLMSFVDSGDAQRLSDS
jgi:hypothetical protein